MRSKLTTRPMLLVAALVLAVAVVGFTALSFARKAETFQSLGFVGIERGASWEVATVESESTGLAPGDQILLINGQELGQLSDPDTLLRQHATSDLVVLRGGELPEHPL